MSATTAAVYVHQIGLVCALGQGAAALRRALSPQSPVLPTVSPFWPRPLPQGLVTLDLPSLQVFPPEQRTRCNALLLAAYRQLEPAARRAIATFGAERVALLIGTSTSGIGEAQMAFTRRSAAGSLPADFALAQQALGTPADFLRSVSGARGPGYVISTACTSAPKAMASAARLLRAGLVDAAIAGGVDALNGYTIAGFDSLECVSERRCNPFSVHRDGINIGEGAGLFLLSREPAGVALAGWGESSDAHHFSAPDPQGRGAIEAMRAALASAKLAPGDIDYLNLHGTATPQNDAMESRAVADVFGMNLPCSSTKPLTGHALGAAGAIEAAFCWQVLREGGALPPHWWDGAADPALAPIRLVRPGETLGRPPRRVMSNSFAFGGSNAALILERVDG